MGKTKNYDYCFAADPTAYVMDVFMQPNKIIDVKTGKSISYLALFRTDIPKFDFFGSPIIGTFNNKFIRVVSYTNYENMHNSFGDVIDHIPQMNEGDSPILMFHSYNIHNF